MFQILRTINYHREQIEILFKAKAGATAANAGLPLIIFFVFKDLIPLPIIAAITILQLIIFTIRMLISSKGLKIFHKASHRQMNHLLKYYLLMVFCSTFLLGITGICVIIYTDIFHMLVFITLYFATASGAMSTLTPVFHAIFSFIFVPLFMILIGVLLIDESSMYHILIALIPFLYLVIALPSAFRIFESISNNISQKKKLEEKNHNFKYLLDTTMEAIILSDSNHKIIDINKSGLTLFKVDHLDNAIGKSIIDYVPPYALQTLQKALQRDKNKPYELDLCKYDGEIFPALISSRSFMMDGQKMRIGTILDLTQIKQNEQLLIQQSRQAAMGEMIGNIAHQWRQPLNALGLVLQNISFEYQMDNLNDAFMERSIKKGKSLTQIMSKTIDDFRDFFKPNKEKKQFSVTEVINNTIELIEASFKNNDITITKNLDDTIELIGYPNEFSQVILNILTNAKDALLENRDENRNVKLTTLTTEHNVIVHIEDNAGGIPNSVIKKIFEPYFTTKEEGKGTGIGLYMSKMIIENNMKGQISVQNSEKGAIFTIILKQIER